MKVTLPDGRILDVMCKHTECGPPRSNLESGVYHKTEIAINLHGQSERPMRDSGLHIMNVKPLAAFYERGLRHERARKNLLNL